MNFDLEIKLRIENGTRNLKLETCFRNDRLCSAEFGTLMYPK